MINYFALTSQKLQQKSPLQSLVNDALANFIPKDESFGFGGFKFTSIEMETISGDLEITDHPVPTGESLNNYSTLKPRTLTQTGLVADVYFITSSQNKLYDNVQGRLQTVESYVDSDAIAEGSKMISDINEKVSGVIGYIDGAVATGKSMTQSIKSLMGSKEAELMKDTNFFVSLLEVLRQERTKFTISAFNQGMENMILQNYEITRKPNSESGIIEVKVTFKEVKEVKNIFITKNVSSFLNSQRSSLINKGKSIGESSTINSNRSVLKKFTNNIL